MPYRNEAYCNVCLMAHRAEELGTSQISHPWNGTGDPSDGVFVFRTCAVCATNVRQMLTTLGEKTREKMAAARASLAKVRPEIAK